MPPLCQISERQGLATGKNSNMSTTAMAHQRKLKQQLRTALADDDECQCWAWVETTTEATPHAMKLLAVNGSFYSFMSHGRECSTCKATTWLVHEDEFYVHWVGRGPNAVGTTITGLELEFSWFMYLDNEEADDEEGDDSLESTVRRVYMAGGLTGERLEERVRERLASA